MAQALVAPDQTTDDEVIDLLDRARLDAARR
jgi:hypothetical protein